MPTYLYRHADPIDPCQDIVRDCTNGEQFEVVQSIKEPALDRCHECNGPVTRLISGRVAVSWKGGSPTPKHYS